MANNKKKIIQTTMDDISPYELEMDLAELRARVDEWIEKYGPDARLDWDKYHYYPYESEPSPRFNILVSREETDAEFTNRLENEKSQRLAVELRERQEFERLQQKFGKAK